MSESDDDEATFSITLRRMGPLAADHWLLASPDKCPACREGFALGQYVTLLALGPGINEDARAAARAGEAYDGVATVMHWACATGRES